MIQPSNPHDDWVSQGSDYQKVEEVCDCVEVEAGPNPTCPICNGTGFIPDFPNEDDYDN